VHGGSAGALAAGLLVVAGCTRVPAMRPVAAAADCHRATAVGAPGPVPAAVEWISPVEPGDEATLARWCATVGPALVGPSPGHFTGGRVDRFVVVTWNQQVGGGDLRRLVADLRAGRLTGGDRVEHFVLLLQESVRRGPSVPPDPPVTAPIPDRLAPDGGETPEDIGAAAAGLGLALFYVPSMRNGRESPGEAPEDRGNAILSTMPLDDFRVVSLPFERQRRASALATVRVSNGAGGYEGIGVASVHLDVWPATIPSLLDGSRRLRQSAAFLSTVPANEIPSVVGADLNSLSSGDPHIGLYRARWPAWEVPSPCRTRGIFCTDYLFVDPVPGWTFTPAMVLPDDYDSDHRPVLTLATRTDGRVAGR